MCGVCHFKNFMTFFQKENNFLNYLFLLLFVNTFSLLDCLKQNTNVP